MKRLPLAVAYATLCVSLAACSSSDSPTPDTPTTPPDTPPTTPVVAHITPIEELNQGDDAVNSHADETDRAQLTMNYRTYTDITSSSLGVTKPHYTRIKKLKDGSYILFYHQNQIGADCYYATSTDLLHWSFGQQLFSRYSITDSSGNKNERRYANCDALVLSNGDIVAVASFRANNGYRSLPKDAGIELRRSTDNGRTWSAPIQIYQGVNWEPYLLEPSPGVLQCYFTDSSRTGTEGADTGTAMVTSADNGLTWSPALGADPLYVLRMKWQKDGKTYFNHQMPSVIRLNGGNMLAAAMETHAPAGYFISLAHSHEDGQWDKLTKNDEGPADSQNLYFSGCAPYLTQFPSGETALSYNSGSKYYLKLGDAQARKFYEAICPFSGSGFWGTLQLIDSHRLIGMMPNTGAGTVMMAQFVLNHRIKATQRTVTVDGGNAEWSTRDDALFVGSKSLTQGTLRCSQDANNIYLLVETRDMTPQINDRTIVMIGSENAKHELAEGSLRLLISTSGLVTAESYQGTWKTYAQKKDLSVKTSVCNGKNTGKEEFFGYVTEIAIPRKALNIQNGRLIVNLGVRDGSGDLDALANMESTNTQKWMVISGL